MDIRENYKRDATEAASLCRPKPKKKAWNLLKLHPASQAKKAAEEEGNA